MKWPFRKQKNKGKVAVNQKQSHRANVERELRSGQPKPPRPHIRIPSVEGSLGWPQDLPCGCAEMCNTCRRELERHRLR